MSVTAGKCIHYIVVTEKCQTFTVQITANIYCELSPTRVKVYQSCTEVLEVAVLAEEAAQKCSCLGSGSSCVKEYIAVAVLETVCVKVEDCSSRDRIEQAAAASALRPQAWRHTVPHLICTTLWRHISLLSVTNRNMEGQAG